MSAERHTCALGFRNVSTCRDAGGAKHRTRGGIWPDARHKGLLGGAAKAVARRWLESDGD
ncbi:hypothetical protein XH93_24475 [Bradyrhizobium sp. CCBAU 51753]|nr:hypothetical protein XH93_24475 [Bradyrhizobium sp. CCBAU 51753]